MTVKKITAASLAAQAMGWIDPVTKAVVPPIHMASTYQRDEDNGWQSEIRQRHPGFSHPGAFC
jgi:cystathionine gamma-synthase